MSKPSSRQAIVETSKIKNINSLKNRSSNQELIASLLLEENSNPLELNIAEIKPHRRTLETTPKIFLRQDHDTINIKDEDLESLSYSITKEEVNRIFQDIITIFRDPFLVSKYLKSLDEELGQKMSDAGIEYDDTDLPQFLIPARGHFIAGSPSESYKPRKQGRILERILLDREMASGINSEGFMPKFAGYVNRNKANEFVSSGHIFAEDAQVDNLILHSKRSHALGLEIIRRAAEMGELNLNIGDTNLNLQQLLEMFVKIQDYPTKNEDISFLKKENSSPMWRYLLDSDEDSMSQSLNKFYKRTKAKLRRGENPTNPAEALNRESYDISNYSYSCRTPNVLNSLVTCFGKELDLPNLQHYQLNSHWKEAAQIVGRAREIIRDEGETKIDTSFSNLYTNCMKLFAKLGKASHSYIINTPISLLAPEAAESLKYAPFQDTVGSDSQIKRKITPAKDVGQYDSWDDYIEQKARQTQEENPARKLSSLETEPIDQITPSQETRIISGQKETRPLLGVRASTPPVSEL